MKIIAEIINTSNPSFIKLIDKTKEFKNLETIFYTSIDDNFRKHCHVANYENSILIITVDNQATATRFRYSIPDITKNLQIHPEFKKLTKIKYIIEYPSKIVTAQSKNKHSKISSHNTKLWEKTLVTLKAIKNNIKLQH
jgi:hypothetical protein